MKAAEAEALQALGSFLDLTDESDWPMIHSVVREDVVQGEYTVNFERAYRKMVDQKLEARGLS